MIAPSDATAPTFRDPAGAVFRLSDRILRMVRPDSVEELKAFLETRTAREAVASGSLISSERFSPNAIPRDVLPHLGFDSRAVFYEHEQVPFPSYPYEWP